MLMKWPVVVLFVLIIPALLVTPACSKKQAEIPFNYPIIKERHIKHLPGKPYSGYKAFYILTEDFEPRVESANDIDQIREVMQFASKLSSQHQIPWTHFVDINTFAPAFISTDEQFKQKCIGMMNDLKIMVSKGDDCQLHLHGPMNRNLIDFLRAKEKLRVKSKADEVIKDYRQRKSFFFHSFYAQGYRELVTSLTYGKYLLEQSIYDGKQQVVTFRAGGWDHGSSPQDTYLYFSSLMEAGLLANSGLASGEFGTQNWSVGNDPGHNLADVKVGDKTMLEISPTSGPGGYLNPVLPYNLEKLANAVNGEMAVIVSVYHLNGIQDIDANSDEILKQRAALERHFQEVADLVSRKILYPITMRELLDILSEQQ